MALWRVHTLTDKQTPANIGRIPMQSAFGKRCKRLHIDAFQCLALTSNTVSGGNSWRHYFFFEWRVWNHCCFRRQECGTEN